MGKKKINGSRKKKNFVILRIKISFSVAIERQYEHHTNHLQLSFLKRGFPHADSTRGGETHDLRGRCSIIAVSDSLTKASVCVRRCSLTCE